MTEGRQGGDVLRQPRPVWRTCVAPQSCCTPLCLIMRPLPLGMTYHHVPFPCTMQGLAVDKSLVLLPAEHPWQHNFELQIGGWPGRCRRNGWVGRAATEAAGTAPGRLGAGPSLPSQPRTLWQPPLPQHLFFSRLPGIRTGYCGSLTTFASWHLELITMAVAQNKVGNGNRMVRRSSCCRHRCCRSGAAAAPAAAVHCHATAAVAGLSA